MADRPERLTTTAARAGITPRVVRYVLAVSLLLAIGAMIWIYLATPVASQRGATTSAPNGATLTAP